METVVLLATEAASEGEFGFNFDILDSNLINLAILIGVLIYFGRGFLGKILSERRADIEQAITDAEQRQKQAAETLAQQQQKLTQAQAEAERIRAEAQERAKALKAQIEAQAIQDVERMKAAASQEMDGERERAIASLRAQAVAMALERSEARLKEQLDHSAQEQLIDRSLALLWGS